LCEFLNPGALETWLYQKHANNANNTNFRK